MQIYIVLCIYICMYVCMYIYIYTCHKRSLNFFVDSLDQASSVRNLHLSSAVMFSLSEVREIFRMDLWDIFYKVVPQIVSVQLVYKYYFTFGLMNGGYIELVIGIINQFITGGAPPCRKILSWDKKMVGGWATPLKNMSSSIGMMKFPIYGKMPKNGNQATNQKIVTSIGISWWFNLTNECDGSMGIIGIWWDLELTANLISYNMKCRQQNMWM